uniref:Uncharacterized protein n=2 Tax=viral metagenome TaxID=1070528 RepID=A0A6M3JRR5_9ZZZZ
MRRSEQLANCIGATECPESFGTRLTQGESKVLEEVELVASQGHPQKRKEKVMEHEISKRYRINVSTSVKGIKTYDCTVDVQGVTMADVLTESDALVAELDKRYPPQIEVK